MLWLDVIGALWLEMICSWKTRVALFFQEQIAGPYECTMLVPTRVGWEEKMVQRRMWGNAGERREKLGLEDRRRVCRYVWYGGWWIRCSCTG